MWGGGKQEGDNHPVSPHSAQERVFPDLAVCVCGGDGGDVARRDHPRAGPGIERGREQAGLGGTERGSWQAFGQAPMYLPVCIQLCTSGGLTTFQTPSQEHPPQPHASPLGAEQDDHMEGIIRQLTFH